MLLDFYKMSVKKIILMHDLFSCHEWSMNIIKTLKVWNNNLKIPIYTSGTTNAPKIIYFNKENVINSIKMTAKYFNFKSNLKVLLCIPANYIGGMMLIFRSIVLKWRLYCIKPTSCPLENNKLIFNFTSMVPIQTINSMRVLDIRVKHLLIGGAPVSLYLDNLINNKLKKTNCYESYGMTETLGHVAIRRINFFKKSKYFTSLYNIYLNQDTNKCLIINAPKIVKNQIITNDIVFLKQKYEKYYFLWLGRKDNLINLGGIKIIPEKIEYILSYYINKDFFVYGYPDTYLGQKLILLIEGDKCNVLLNNFILKKIRYLKLKNIFFVKFFIRNSNGKINRIKTIKLVNFKNKILDVYN